MKNIIRTITLLGVISSMALSMTACKPTKAPTEVIIDAPAVTTVETTVTEETTVAETFEPRTERKEGGLIEDNNSYKILEYGTSGKLEKFSVYYGDGTLAKYGLIEYTDDGHEIYHYFRAEGTFYGISKYDAEGNKLIGTTYNGVPAMSFNVSEYDSNGNNTKMSMYTLEGELDWYIINEYDEEGRHIRYTEYDAEGTFIREILYDENGFPIG